MIKRENKLQCKHQKIESKLVDDQKEPLALVVTINDWLVYYTETCNDWILLQRTSKIYMSKKFHNITWQSSEESTACGVERKRSAGIEAQSGGRLRHRSTRWSARAPAGTRRALSACCLLLLLLRSALLSGSSGRERRDEGQRAEAVAARGSHPQSTQRLAHVAGPHRSVRRVCGPNRGLPSIARGGGGGRRRCVGGDEFLALREQCTLDHVGEEELRDSCGRDRYLHTHRSHSATAAELVQRLLENLITKQGYNIIMMIHNICN